MWGDATLVLISSDTPDINSIKSITAFLNSEWITITKDELTIIDSRNDPLEMLGGAMYGEYPTIIIDYLQNRLFFVYDEDVGYVSSVTFEEGVTTINPKYLPEGGFGYTSERTTILEEQEVTIALVDGTNDILGNIPGEFPIAGEELTIIWDGVEYVSNLFESGGGQYAYMIADGVGLVYDSNPDKLGLTFISGTSGIGTHTIAIYKGFEAIHRIDPIYLPEGGFGYTSIEFGCVVPETIITISNNMLMQSGLIGLKEGYEYVINWNGTDYTCVAKTGTLGSDSFVYIGNAYIADQDTYPNTGEPFVIGDLAADGLSGYITPVDGTYTISIKGDIDVINKIDAKYLDIPQSDYSQNDETAQDYIKNKPFFNEKKIIDVSTLTEENTIVLYPVPIEPAFKLVKLMDYKEPGEWLCHIEVACEGRVINLSGARVFRQDENYWDFADIDVIYFYGFDKAGVVFEGVTIPEPGIYAYNTIPFLGTNPIYKIPNLKTIDKSFIDISYNDLANRPFGDFSEEIIGYPYQEGNFVARVEKRDSEGYIGTPLNTFYTLSLKSISADDIIGATLTLSDGTERIVTKNDIFVKDDNVNFWEIQDLLISFDKTIYGDGVYDGHIGNYYYTFSLLAIAGIYTSNHTGVYVTKIKLPSRIHKIDSKYLSILSDGLTTITYDGNGEKVTVTAGADEVTLVKVSNEVIDLNTVDNVQIKFKEADASDNSIIYTKDELFVTKISDVDADVITPASGNIPLIISNRDVSVLGEAGIGTFVIDMLLYPTVPESGVYVSNFDCVKPIIKSEYLPAAVDQNALDAALAKIDELTARIATLEAFCARFTEVTSEDCCCHSYLIRFLIHTRRLGGSNSSAKFSV